MSRPSTLQFLKFGHFKTSGKIDVSTQKHDVKTYVITSIDRKPQIIQKNKLQKIKQHNQLLTKFGATSPTMGATNPGRKSTIIVLVQILKNLNLQVIT